MVLSEDAEHLSDPVPPDDRAFLYGDGLFETLLAIDGHLHWLSLHRSRLLEGARRLNIACSWPDIETALKKATPAVGAHVVRLTLSRGSGARGYRPDDGPSRIRVRCSALGRDPRSPRPAARLAVSSIKLGDQPLLAGLKHCNRLENVLAAGEAEAAGVDDVVMLNGRDEIQCTSGANVFALAGDTLLTPNCLHCGIAGTRRRLIMEELAPSQGLKVVERNLPISEWRAVDAAFMSNSIVGMRVIGSLGDHSYATSPVLVALQQAYFERLGSCSEH